MEYLMLTVYTLVVSAFEWHCVEVHHEFFAHGQSDCPEEDMTAYVGRVRNFMVEVRVAPSSSFVYGEVEWLSVVCG